MMGLKEDKSGSGPRDRRDYWDRIMKDQAHREERRRIRRSMQQRNAKPSKVNNGEVDVVLEDYEIDGQKFFFVKEEKSTRNPKKSKPSEAATTGGGDRGRTSRTELRTITRKRFYCTCCGKNENIGGDAASRTVELSNAVQKNYESILGSVKPHSTKKPLETKTESKPCKTPQSDRKRKKISSRVTLQQYMIDGEIFYFETEERFDPVVNSKQYWKTFGEAKGPASNDVVSAPSGPTSLPTSPKEEITEQVVAESECEATQLVQGIENGEPEVVHEVLPTNPIPIFVTAVPAMSVELDVVNEITTGNMVPFDLKMQDETIAVKVENLPQDEIARMAAGPLAELSPSSQPAKAIKSNENLSIQQPLETIVLQEAGSRKKKSFCRRMLDFLLCRSCRRSDSSEEENVVVDEEEVVKPKKNGFWKSKRNSKSMM